MLSAAPQQPSTVAGQTFACGSGPVCSHHREMLSQLSSSPTLRRRPFLASLLFSLLICLFSLFLFFRCHLTLPMRLCFCLGSGQEMNGLALDEQGGYCVSACGDGCAYLWDTSSMKLIGSMNSKTGFLQCVSTLTTLGQVAVGGNGANVLLWDPRSAASPRKFSMGATCRWVGALATSPSGEWLACGTSEGVRLVHAPSQVLTTRMQSESSSSFPVNALTFTSEGVASVGMDARIQHWTLNGQLAYELSTPSTALYAVSVHQDKTTTVCGSAGAVHVFDDLIYPRCSVLLD
eukprot:m.386306 g.386306  ORF g.386306 m.386306 type:complete len:291 (-) comp56298_c1_seq1:78-950(-)